VVEASKTQTIYVCDVNNAAHVRKAVMLQEHQFRNNNMLYQSVYGFTYETLWHCRLPGVTHILMHINISCPISPAYHIRSFWLD